MGVAPARHNGAVVVDSTLLTSKVGGAGKISRVLDGVFQAERWSEDADDNNFGQCCDIGPESDEEWESYLSDRLRDPEDGGISELGLTEIEAIIWEFRRCRTCSSCCLTTCKSRTTNDSTERKRCTSPY